MVTAPGETRIVDVPRPAGAAMGYPDEIFEVTKDLVADWEKYAVIVSHPIPFDDVDEALRTASTPVPPTRSSDLD